MGPVCAHVITTGRTAQALKDQCSSSGHREEQPCILIFPKHQFKGKGKGSLIYNRKLSRKQHRVALWRRFATASARLSVKIE